MLLSEYDESRDPYGQHRAVVSHQWFDGREVRSISLPIWHFLREVRHVLKNLRTSQAIWQTLAGTTCKPPARCNFSVLVAFMPASSFIDLAEELPKS